MVGLHRTRAEWLEEVAWAGGGARIDDRERAGLARMRQQLLTSANASTPDVADALRLIETILRLGRKAEQERW